MRDGKTAAAKTTGGTRLRKTRRATAVRWDWANTKSVLVRLESEAETLQPQHKYCKVSKKGERSTEPMARTILPMHGVELRKVIAREMNTKALGE